jgi:hypothetical protein
LNLYVTAMRASATLSLALLLVVQASLADRKQPQVIIHLHAPRAEIRAAFLQQTPSGSSIEYVVGFISKRLERSGSGRATISVQPAGIPSQPLVAKTIHVYLGQYYKHLGALFLTAPMVVHENVSAQWLFDRNGRLIDVVVDKQARVY